VIDKNYNDILQQPWISSGYDVIYQACCLQIPDLDDGYWQIRYPEFTMTKDTVVLMHCQDFVNVDHDRCRELELIQQHFGDRCDQVVAITWNKHLDTFYDGPIHVAHFPTHSFEILVNLGRITASWMPRLTGTRQHVWQCLNGVPKKHRVRTVQALQPLSNGILSLNPDIPIPDWPYYPCYQTCSNEENFLRLLPIYGDCDINIVTETMYAHRPGIITEKTILALLSLQVPLVIGHPGIVADLASIGFDVFEDVLDVSYDHMPNHQRAEAAIELNMSVLKHGIDREQLLPRLLRNQQLALEWPQRMIADYEHQVRVIQDRRRGS
jgi:hypothetical protein